MHQSHAGRPHNVRPHSNYNQGPPPPQIMRPAHYMAPAPPSNMQPGPQHPPLAQQMMSQYIPTASAHPQPPQSQMQQQRNDPNRLGHHMAQQQSSQQPQRISPQMLQPQVQPQQIHHTGIKQRPQQLQANAHQQQNHQPNIINHHHANGGINQNIPPSIGLQNPPIKHHINNTIPQSISHPHVTSTLQQPITVQHQGTNKNIGNSINNNYHGKMHVQNKINNSNNVINNNNNNNNNNSTIATNNNVTTTKKDYNTLQQQPSHLQKLPTQNPAKTIINCAQQQPKVTILKNQNRISPQNTSNASLVKTNVNSTQSNNYDNSKYAGQIKQSFNSNESIAQTNSSNNNTTIAIKIKNQEKPLDNAIIKNSSSKENGNGNENNNNNNNNNISKELNNNLKSNILSAESLPNGKEKTPMCLVNELARYNKIQHQYRLTGEQGPAHSKRFTVTLKLGDEEYTAEGPSIKKAQHTAAAEAVGKTKYEHPPPKAVRHKSTSRSGASSNITPTVELNALAMKLGEPTVYVFDSTSSNNVGPGYSTINSNQSNDMKIASNHSVSSVSNFQSNYHEQSRTHPNNIYINGGSSSGNPRFTGGRGRPHLRGGYMKCGANQRMVGPYGNLLPNYPRDTCKITLIVGKEKFTGVGPTVQMAKHDAASKALEILRPLGEASDSCQSHNNSSEESISDVKSPISQVHELALKRNFTVNFEVKSEVGPPHLKTFITICQVGPIIVEAEGNGKKISKKRAADKMLEELRKLPPLSPDKAVVTSSTALLNKNGRGRGRPQHQLSQQNQTPMKRRTKNLVKEKMMEPIESSEEGNPISKLIQIQQSLKEREPVYTVVEEKGAPRRREFTIEVVTNGKSARGSGSTKKMAKKNAAKSLLALLGHVTPSNSINVNNVNGNINESVTTSVVSSTKESPKAVPVVSQSGVSSRQIVPGIIHLPSNVTTSSSPSPQLQKINRKQIKQKVLSQIPEEKPLELQNAVNPDITKDAKLSENADEEVDDEIPKEFGVRPKDQLLYLAQLLGFQVGFTDYPKGNHGEFLTIVTLSTDPPQICHGAGQDTISSQDKAALKALQMLQALKLDNLVKPKQKDEKKSKTTVTDKDNS